MRFLRSSQRHNFYPRPPRGGRPCGCRSGRGSRSISIHALREEGDRVHLPKADSGQNFYPRPPRGGRLPQWSLNRLFIFISIHALREEGDGLDRLDIEAEQGISIHALREEGDRAAVGLVEVVVQFLSTPSARRATEYIYQKLTAAKISIHALREEGDSPSGA